MIDEFEVRARSDGRCFGGFSSREDALGAAMDRLAETGVACVVVQVRVVAVADVGSKVEA